MNHINISFLQLKKVSFVEVLYTQNNVIQVIKDINEVECLMSGLFYSMQASSYLCNEQSDQTGRWLNG